VLRQGKPLRTSALLPSTVINTDDELPGWMRRTLRATDYGVVLAALFSLLIAWSFIVQTEIPRTNDFERYVFRTADTATTLSEGRLYPRWSAHVLSGYGAPIPHYIPPMTAYLPAVIDVLFINDPIIAVRLMCIIAFLIAGTAVYSLVARSTNASTGMLASLLYLYSPIIGIVTPHLRGDLPALLVFALIPAYLWALDAALSRPRPIDYVILIGAFSGLILTDGALITITALALGTPFFIRRMSADASPRRRLRALCALICGAGLSAFFWLPALRESTMVQWQTSPLASSIRPNWLELFTPFALIDSNALRPTEILSLGLPIIIATFAVFPLWLREKTLYFQRVFGIFGITIVALWWGIFPDYLSLLGIGVMCLAIGASAVMNWQPRLSPLLSRLFLPILCIGILIASIGVWLTPHWRASDQRFDGLAQIEFEEAGFGIAVLPDNQPIPQTLSPAFTRNPLILSGYRTGQINRIELIDSSAALQFGTLVTLSHSTRFQVRSVADAQFRFLTAQFPGWQITNSTTRADLQPELTTGLMTISAAAGTSEITVELGTTDVRQISWVVSAFSLVGVVLLIILSRRTAPDWIEAHAPLALEETRLIAIIAITFTILLVLFAMPFSPAPLTTRPGIGLDGSSALRARSDIGLEAIAFRLDRTQYRRGDTIDALVYWRVLRPLDTTYLVQASLVSRITGTRVSSGALHHPGGYPTPRWLTNAYIADQLRGLSTAELIPGEYNFALEVFQCRTDESCDTENRLSFFDANGASVGRLLILPPLIIITD